jgi:hypothetical protein
LNNTINKRENIMSSVRNKVYSQQDLVNSYNTVVTRRREQARLNRNNKMLDGLLSIIAKPGEIFDEAIEIVSNLNFEPINITYNHVATIQLIAAIRALKEKTTFDVESRRLSQNDAEILEEATRELVISGNVIAFQKATSRFNSTWIKLLFALTTAIVVFFAGIAIAPVSLSAPLCGLADAAGTVAAFMLASNIFSFFTKPSPLLQIENSAKEVYSVENPRMI